jgi:hypothetical protein
MFVHSVLGTAINAMQQASPSNLLLLPVAGRMEILRARPQAADQLVSGSPLTFAGGDGRQTSGGEYYSRPCKICASVAVTMNVIS